VKTGWSSFYFVAKYTWLNGESCDLFGKNYSNLSRLPLIELKSVLPTLSSWCREVLNFFTETFGEFSVG